MLPDISRFKKGSSVSVASVEGISNFIFLFGQLPVVSEDFDSLTGINATFLLDPVSGSEDPDFRNEFTLTVMIPSEAEHGTSRLSNGIPSLYSTIFLSSPVFDWSSDESMADSMRWGYESLADASTSIFSEPTSFAVHRTAI